MWQRSYRPEIDGLRAVAVAAVVLFHAGLGCPGGYVGVDVFFVISGFLITGLILKDLDAGSFTFTGFWERRVRRILPASLVMTAAVLLIGSQLLLSAESYKLGKSALAHLCFAANFQLWRGIGDYFSGPAEYFPLGHTWSLAIEEQFYLLFPGLLYALRGRRGSTTATVLAGLGVASLALSIVGTTRFPAATFYLLPARSWELLLGSGIAYAARRSWSPAKPIVETTAWIGLAGILAPIFLYDSRTPFPGVAALPPCLGCAAVIWANTRGTTFVGRLLSLRPLTAIGLISYSLYLWHWPIFSYYRIVYGAHLPPLTAVALTGLSVVVAGLSWRFIETPFRVRRWGAERRVLFRQVAVASGALVAVAAAYVATRGFAKSMPTDLLADTEVVGKSFDVPRHAVPDKLPAIGVPSDERADFILWGDSHALFLVDAVDAAAKRSNLAGYAAIKAGAPPLPGVWRADESVDLRWSDFVVDFLLHRQVKHAVLAARWRMYVEGFVPHELAENRDWDEQDMRIRAPGTRTSTPDEARQLLFTSLDETARRLHAHGIKVWLLRQVPEHDQNRLSLRWMRHRLKGTPFESPVFSSAEHEQTQRRVNEVLEQVARRNPNVVLLDPAAALFDDSAASATVIRDGRCLYYDGNHVSAFGAQWIVDRLFPTVLTDMQATQTARNETPSPGARR